MSDRTLTAHDYPPAVPAVGTGGASCADAGRLQSPQGGGDVAGKAATHDDIRTNSYPPSYPAAAGETRTGSAAVGAQVVSGLDPVGAAAMPISGPRTSGVMRGPEVPDDEPQGQGPEDASKAQDVTAGRDRRRLQLCMGCNEDLPPGSIASRKWCDECIRKRRNKRKAERDREIRAQLGVSARQYKRTHARRTTIGKGRCRVCAGLSERRPRIGVCGGCGLPWLPERQIRVEDFTSSGAGALGRACESRVR